jgi:hypothetical protein
MKNLFLSLCFLLSTVTVFAQGTPAEQVIFKEDDSLELRAMERAALQERQTVLLKQQQTARKEQDKALRAIETEEKRQRDAQQALTLNEEQQQKKVQAIAALRSVMNNLDLESIEKDIKQTRRESAQLERLNRRKANSIEKKKAQIARLLADIDLLEQEIVQNESSILQKEDEIKVEQKMIDDNDLVSKTQQVELLEKEMKSLKAKHKRETLKKQKAAEKTALAKISLEEAKRLQADCIKELANIRAALSKQTYSAN